MRKNGLPVFRSKMQGPPSSAGLPAMPRLAMFRIIATSSSDTKLSMTLRLHWLRSAAWQPRTYGVYELEQVTLYDSGSGSSSEVVTRFILEERNSRHGNSASTRMGNTWAKLRDITVRLGGCLRVPALVGASMFSNTVRTRKEVCCIRS